VMGFKSKQMPASEVFEASGRECLKFEKKYKSRFRKFDFRF